MKFFIIPVLVLFSLAACKNDDDCAEEVCTYSCVCEYEDGTIRSIPTLAYNRNDAKEFCENSVPLDPTVIDNPPINCYLE